ncbi:MAG: helix-turn-helix transcriptional regulator [Chloroflexota bacterium]
MTPPRALTRPTSGDDPDAATGAARRLALRIGLSIHDERRRRGWSFRELASKAGLAASTVHAIENGAAASAETYIRLSSALGQEFQAGIVGRAQPDHQRDGADLVHAAMGEAQAATLQRQGMPVRLDEPWQHYHFSGRADLISWNPAWEALLHIENRTRYPDVQDSVGRFNAKRSYLATALWRALGFRRPPTTEVHVMVAIWSSEVLRVIRRDPATFRATCPDPPQAYLDWLSGIPPTRTRVTTFVLFDPFATGRRRRFLDLESALDGARARIHDYAEAAALLQAQH